MLFTVELAGPETLFRLQKDVSWRACASNRLHPTDLVCMSAREAVMNSDLKEKLRIGKILYDIEPEREGKRPAW